MSTLFVLLCHPYSKSFNHAVAARVRERLAALGHELLFHDLYAEGFDPVLSQSELRRRFSLDELVQVHYRNIERSEGLIVIHPEWWSQPPAMLKGWIDRVLGPGIGYEFEGEEFMAKSRVPLLGGKRALVLATTDSQGAAKAGAGSSSALTGGEPLLSALWRETLAYCGIVDFHFRMLLDVRGAGASERLEWIEETAALACELFPEATPPTL
ncbi:MAG TPA: NAD(P)H-dependent oxidoreductase [Spirochaetia bacterium]|nr:NAD(P)H-dependent oxidoreductase [Spirochaetia bacterium]